jgi:hypothetical protein
MSSTEILCFDGKGRGYPGPGTMIFLVAPHVHSHEGWLAADEGHTASRRLHSLDRFDSSDPKPGARSNGRPGKRNQKTEREQKAGSPIQSIFLHHLPSLPPALTARV